MIQEVLDVWSISKKYNGWCNIMALLPVADRVIFMTRKIIDRKLNSSFTAMKL